MRTRFFNLIYIFAAVTTAMSLYSCDEVDEADRLIYVKPAAVGRCVLIEDYTAQRCVNCPNAADEIHKLQEQYGADTVIAVGIHAGQLAKSPRGVPYSLWTEDGDEYNNRWSIESWPKGVIDRQGQSEHTEWASIVRQELQKTASLSLTATSTGYDATSRKAAIQVQATGTDGSTNGNIQLWLTEDNIVDFQYMPDGSVNREYVHNHVYRTSVNGIWGDSFSLNEGETKTLEFTATLDEDGKWVAENMHVVAFVYNDNGVQQVTTCPLVPTSENTDE